MRKLRYGCTLNADYIIKKYIQKSEKCVKNVYYYLSFDGYDI